MRVLILHSKHADVYFDASTPKNTLRAYYEMIRYNNMCGYYYEPQVYLPSRSKEDDQLLSLDEEAVKNLPDFLRKKHAQLQSEVTRAYKNIEREMVLWKGIQKILAMSREEAIVDNVKQHRKNKDGQMVVSSRPTLSILVDFLGDSEYERYTLEDVETYED